jgi:hypothetical protein
MQLLPITFPFCSATTQKNPGWENIMAITSFATSGEGKSGGKLCCAAIDRAACARVFFGTMQRR